MKTLTQNNKDIIQQDEKGQFIQRILCVYHSCPKNLWQYQVVTYRPSTNPNAVFKVWRKAESSQRYWMKNLEKEGLTEKLQFGSLHNTRVSLG